MDAFFKDLRFGIRGLLKSPGFTAIAVITLALGIGANCAIFSVVNAIFIRTLPFQDPDRLIWVWDVQPQPKQAPASYPEFVDWRNMNQVFEQMSSGRGASFNLTETGDPERLPGYSVTANFFQMVEINAEPARSFLPEEAELGNDQVVPLSTHLWRRRLGGDPAILGKTISLNGKSYIVISIIPPMSAFLTSAEVFTPLGLDVAKTDRRTHFLNVVALRYE
ncbi:MAG: ABC transporter permease [Acidobacteriia bacterium]|nr:ABC transporter permease [Terriglobia bacterium]